MLYDDDKNDLAQNLQAYEQQRTWKQEFIELGGFTHLLNCLVGLDLQKITSTLELKAIMSLLSTLFNFFEHHSETQQAANAGLEQPNAIVSLMSAQSKEIRQACALKVINLIDNVCKFSIEQETKRGESIEDINKSIEKAKLKKQRDKLKMIVNAKRPQNDDEDDGDSEEKKKRDQLLVSFKEQADIVKNLFNFLNEVFSRSDRETLPTVIMGYPQLSQMLERGMILTENFYLRRSMSDRIRDILLAVHDQDNIEESKSTGNDCFAMMLKTMLSSLV